MLAVAELFVPVLDDVAGGLLFRDGDRLCQYKPSAVGADVIEGSELPGQIGVLKQAGGGLH